MDSVIEQLAEIETTAEAIVDHAEEEKHKIEKRIQADVYKRQGLYSTAECSGCCCQLCIHF